MSAYQMRKRKRNGVFSRVGIFAGLIETFAGLIGILV